MAEQTESYLVTANDIHGIVQALNMFLPRIADRLDKLEGLRPSLSDGYLKLSDKELSTAEVADIVSGTDGRVEVSDDGEIDVVLKDDSGIGSDSNGLYVLLKDEYGLDVDSDGLKLKQQSHITDAVAVTAFTLDAGVDSVDRSGFNTDLANLFTEIDDLKDVINSILTALEAMEALATA